MQINPCKIVKNILTFIIIYVNISAYNLKFTKCVDREKTLQNSALESCWSVQSSAHCRW